MKVFISPHCDDETLFGAFTILREQPIVVIVFDSVVQYQRGTGITGPMRRNETIAAMEILGAEVRFLQYSDAERNPNLNDGLIPYLEAEEVWAPAFEEGGHPQHNLVARWVRGAWINKPEAVTHYMTYTTAGKSTGRPVPIEDGWLSKKFAALSCYQSQIDLPNTREHFLREQREYYL